MTRDGATVLLFQFLSSLAEKGEPVKFADDDGNPLEMTVEDVSMGLPSDAKEPGELTVSIFDGHDADIIHLKVKPQ